MDQKLKVIELEKKIRDIEGEKDPLNEDTAIRTNVLEAFWRVLRKEAVWGKDVSDGTSPLRLISAFFLFENDAGNTVISLMT